MSSKPTSEVNLRPWSQGDLPLLQRLLGDEKMTEHLGGPERPEKIHNRHEKYVNLPSLGADRMFVILAGPEQIPTGSVEWQGEEVWETGWSVLPEFQGQGLASKATAILIELVRQAGKHRFLHAYPSVDNAPSNAICRKLGFVLNGEYEFEYPKDHFMRCNDWAFDLYGGSL